MIDPLSDAKVIDSWHHNVSAWTAAVRNEEIASRRLVTNAAIVDAVRGRSPRTALDLGCGEGWLVRALVERGVQATGVDAVPALIEAAERAGGGTYHVLSYEQIAEGALDLTTDVVVANFALIGEHAVAALLRRVPSLLTAAGVLTIQTVHPVLAGGDEPYVDGWRTGSWAGFSADFVDPAPWYFRTIGSWLQLLAASGLRLLELREPLHPTTGKPASLILIAEAAS